MKGGGNEKCLGALKEGGMKFLNIKGGISKRGEIKPEGGGMSLTK